MFIIKYQKFFIGLSTLFVAASIALVAIFGLPLGIDFKGGSQLQLEYQDARPVITEIKSTLSMIPDAVVQPVGEKGITIKTHTITETEKSEIVDALSKNAKVTESSFTTIGPSVGSELTQKAIVSIVLVLVSIILFVAYAFRKVSYPVSSWKYGAAVIIALIHDIAIPLGVFAVLGHVGGAEVDTLFVVALLTTLALSISDTIVVFDRVREHLGDDTKHEVPFETVVSQSLTETFARSINTSLVVLAVVVTLAIAGPASTQLFATVLAIGLFFGMYSSIFFASPLLLLFEKAQKKDKK